MLQCQLYDNPKVIPVTRDLMDEFSLPSLDHFHQDEPRDKTISMLDLLKKVIHR